MQKSLFPANAGIAALLLCAGNLQAAINIVFDYTYDTTGFFSDANLSRRDVLEAVATTFESRLTQESFPGITPSGVNTWELFFPHPSTNGAEVTLTNPTIPPNELRVYVGARDLTGSLIGRADYGYQYSGNAAWVTMFQARDSIASFDSFGGAIAFDIVASQFYFDSDPTTLEPFPGQFDFYTLVLHEMGHLLGYGTDAFASRITSNEFYGANSVERHGGPVDTNPDQDHWAQTVMDSGQTTVMVPTLSQSQRRYFTELDWAGLEDIGYIVDVVPEPSVGVFFLAGIGVCGIRRNRRR